jgi:hypothetical protein
MNMSMPKACFLSTSDNPDDGDCLSPKKYQSKFTRLLSPAAATNLLSLAMAVV